MSLFDKKVDCIKDNEEQEDEAKILMIDQKMKEMEIKLTNLETKVNELLKEAKSKLKSGDILGAKNVLKEKLKIDEQLKKEEELLRWKHKKWK